MISSLRFVLLQIRDSDDPMREHEVGVFCRALGIRRPQLRVVSLLEPVTCEQICRGADCLLVGGAGAYSVARETPWLWRTLEVLRAVCETGVPMFASCWGFQAVARALGGEVVHDPQRAEVGTFPVFLTEEGKRDPVFGPLGSPFQAQMGHEDRVARLPKRAVRLAYSERVENQAYRLVGRPVYCTQFHPELRREDLLERLATYPEYLERTGCGSFEEFAAGLREAPETERLLRRFVDLYVVPRRATTLRLSDGHGSS
ncbi:MAG: type 1 glutamine amidotransferase [Planctomycetota bacterium]|nr:MAG: type 1 glutamine amidotransferase [Planctomycetota bacterium]